MILINILTNILILTFIFITSFLLHELMHIKSQGVKARGKIFVNEYGMTCCPYLYKDETLCSFAGGIYTSIIMFIMAFCSVGFWQWSFLTMGYVHLFYGLYEGFVGVKYRYLIYITVIVIMMMLWVVK